MMDQIVTGSTDTHLVSLDQSHSGNVIQSIHKQVLTPFFDLQTAAQNAGFELKICSAYRSFDRQLQIWNGKLSGMRPVMDPFGKPINIQKLNPWQKIQAILRWSALPGASRHHWGTDFDIYDASAMPENYQIQLIPEEVQGNGLFAPMHNWLDSYIESGKTDFYRPYKTDKGGIAPERWHLSYRPLADKYAEILTRELLAARLKNSDLMLLDEVLKHLDDILQRYIIVD
ncbi:MAG: M15 family metallopeptidase [Porticoccaceae bacterium]|nr:M15 family metallopeptidase [Porticoccaceae bacterium]